MKSHLLYQPTRSSPTETVAFVGLGLVALFTVILAVRSMSNFVQGKDKVVAALSGGSQVASHNTSGVGYIASGQWRADARTLMAMARWVLESDAVMTNVATVPSNTPGTSVSISTNSTRAAPKA